MSEADICRVDVRKLPPLLTAQEFNLAITDYS